MRMKNAQKKPTNVSLSADLVSEAKELGVNISRASERGLVAEISAKRKEKWLAENRSKIEAWNDWVDQNGMPLAEYRQF